MNDPIKAWAITFKSKKKKNIPFAFPDVSSQDYSNKYFIIFFPFELLFYIALSKLLYYISWLLGWTETLNALL